MKLSDIKPQRSSFFLKSCGLEFFMNPISLSDDIWLAETFGDRLREVLVNVDIEGISEIVFRVMDIESKKQLKKQEIDLVSIDGEITTESIGGLALLRTMIQGFEDKTLVAEALFKNIENSRPLMKDIDVEEADSKKKA